MSAPIPNDQPINLEESGIYELDRVLDCTQEVGVKLEETQCCDPTKSIRCDVTHRELLQNHFPSE